METSASSLPVTSSENEPSTETGLLCTLRAGLTAALDEQHAAEDSARVAADRLASSTFAVQYAQAALDAVELAIGQAKALLRPRKLATYQAHALAEIFRACLPVGDIHRATGDSPRRVPSAFVVAGVCKHWRAVALDTPAIWTSVVLDFSELAHADKYLDLILSRSRNHAIHVRMRSVPPTFPEDGPLSEAMLVRLLGQSKSLTMRFSQAPQSPPPAPTSVSILQYLQADMPRLERVFVVEGASLATSRLSTTTQLLTLAPKLKTLSTTRALYAFVVPELLPAVEVLDVHGAPPLASDDLVRLSRAWPRLRRLVMYGVQCAPGDARGAASFPRLECLTFLTHHSPFPLLTVQTAPLLSSVAHAGPPTDLLSFLGTGSFTSLTSLVLLAVTVSGIQQQISARMLEFVSQGVLASLPRLVRLGFFVVPAVLIRQFFEIWSAQLDLVVQPTRLAELNFISIPFDTPAAQAVLNFLALRRTASAGGMPALNVTFAQKEKKDGRGFPAWLLPQLQRLAGKVTHREEENLQKLLP